MTGSEESQTQTILPNVCSFVVHCCNDKLARSIKFTVQPGGKFDDGIATSNQLGSDRAIVPVQIIGDQDGMWNKIAWQTEAFYGNPLKGFSAVP